jgi:hypothetical protein
LPFADKFRRLESVHVGHADIEQDHREILPEEKSESLLAGFRPDEILAEVFEDGLEGDKIFLSVIHKKYVCFVPRVFHVWE